MKVSIIGATGYTGSELLRLLSNHSDVEILYITSESSTGKFIKNSYPHLEKFYDHELTSMKDMENICSESDIVFVALPHGHAMEIGKTLQNKKARIIDLGADYRFNNPAVYEKWYKVEHTDKTTKAVYGLTELYREKIKTAKILANPGCYTTASILALTPLIKENLIKLDNIIIDAKSGVTGAGRSLKLGSLFCEVNDNFQAYSATKHRHTPEIEQALSEFAQQEILVSFTPHLLPIDRGILATSYANLQAGVTASDIARAFNKHYGNEYFIRLRGEGVYPATKHVRGSNFVDIGWEIDSRLNRIVLMSALDNLVKGAAGQAIQNMNVMCGLPEKTGLTQVPLYP